MPVFSVFMAAILRTTALVELPIKGLEELFAVHRVEYVLDL